MSLPISPITNGESGSSVRAKLNQIISDSSPSISTPKIIYVETDGNDATAEIGNPALPFATAETAYNVGVSTASPFVLSLGWGDYTITLYNDFSPNCWCVNGKGSSIVFGRSATNLSIVNYFNGISAINSNGVYGFNVSINAFNVNLTLDVSGQPVTVNDGGGYSGGTGGSVSIFGNAVIQFLSVAGGGDAGSSDGSVSGGNCGSVSLDGGLVFNKNTGYTSMQAGTGFNGGDGMPGTLIADDIDLRCPTFVMSSSTQVQIGRCSYYSYQITPTVDKGGNAIY